MQLSLKSGRLDVTRDGGVRLDARCVNAGHQSCQGINFVDALKSRVQCELSVPSASNLIKSRTCCALDTSETGCFKRAKPGLNSALPSMIRRCFLTAPLALQSSARFIRRCRKHSQSLEYRLGMYDATTPAQYRKRRYISTVFILGMYQIGKQTRSEQSSVPPQPRASGV